MIERPIPGPAPRGGEAKTRAYMLSLDATLAPGERRRVVNSPTVVPFRVTRIVVARDVDVDVLVAHHMITNSKPESRHKGLPCSFGNLFVRLVPGHVVIGRCEIDGEIGFDIENKSGIEQRFFCHLLGQGFES